MAAKVGGGSRSPAGSAKLAAKGKGPAEKARVVGPYVLGRVHRERGLLATYAADDRALGRTALVRTAAPNVALGERLTQHLAAEARLVAKAAGEGVVMLYDAAPDGSYYAMEDPEGPSLDEVLHGEGRAEISTEAAIAIVARMAACLATVHAAGLVHGAVEPSALYLSKRRTLVLAGFDRAHAAGAHDAAAEEPERGATGTAYAAPEQIIGEATTAESDVFSLGVIAYELLAGAHPFALAEPAQEKGPGDIAHRIRTEHPPAMPSARGVPIDLERLIQRALGKSPGHRPASGVELVKEISAIALPEGRDAELHKLLAKLGLREGKAPLALAAGAAAELERDLAPEDSARPVALRLGAIFAAMIAVGVAFHFAERGDAEGATAREDKSPGFVRVLAHPWAEVWVDGALVDTTPIGHPLKLSSGRHAFVFRHPRADEERRLVDVPPAATTTLDVTMKVARPPIDAGVDASP